MARTSSPSGIPPHPALGSEWRFGPENPALREDPEVWLGEDGEFHTRAARASHSRVGFWFREHLGGVIDPGAFSVALPERLSNAPAGAREAAINAALSRRYRPAVRPGRRAAMAAAHGIAAAVSMMTG